MTALFDVIKLLKPGAFSLFFLTATLCSKKESACQLPVAGDESPLGYLRDVNCSLHVLQQHFHWIKVRTWISYEFLKHFLAFIYAIEEINDRTDILPNITLGFRIYDSCTSENLAVKSALSVISETQELIPNYMCQGSQKTVAVVGHLLSSSTYTIARVAQLFGYPQISYGALNSALSENFPLLYRTVPSESSQFHVIIQLLLHFSWTWVGIITTEDDSSQQASVELKKQMEKRGICVDFISFISMDSVDFREKSLHVIKKLETSSVNVVILFGTEIPFVGFLETGERNMRGKVWITTSGMEGIIKDVFPNFNFNFNGSLAITIQKGKILGFKNFLFQATLNNMPDNTFVNHFWLLSYGCYDVHEALHQMHLAELLFEPSSLHFKEKLKSKLNRYLKNVTLKTPSGADIFFNNKGYIEGNFDVLNFVARSDSRITSALVGSWSSSASNQLQINESAIVWNPYFIQTPRSMCTDPCSPGYRQSLETGKLKCCFECVQCNDGEITNGTAMESCEICPDDQWSNPARDKCIKRPLHFLSYEEELGMSLAVIAAIFFGITTSVLWVFGKNRNTPLVRANNRNLSYVLLVSLMICFLLSFMFIGCPKELTCLMRQTTFGFVFAVAISSVLGKTTTVLIAFNATKPGSKLRKFVGSRIPNGLVILCSMGQFMICVTWLILAPPFVELDTKTIPGIIIVECNEGSIIAFYVVVSYIGVLAIFSFIIAFISRRLPDTFNEAQFITFSMLVFCSVWICFIPTYVCTKGKYMVAVEIFAILASNGALLFFLFFPKCYIILIKPKKNKIITYSKSS
ncbi:vomeronasal type-2 receptor 26-like [Dendropsophus ebraccatus]|uniref:vomeronasal type-2 receptor 26-like n=1 Tax=Dendropsophus ebraccatus TaxID=150705 RepID=UPI00383102A6